MAKKLSGKYYIKNTSAGSYSDVTTLYDGVNILAVEGMDAKGKALNVYYEQWIDGSVDFQIAGNNGVIARENVDITVVFVVSQRYAAATIDVETVYNNFINYMTNTDVWVKSGYNNKQVHCVSIDSFEPEKVVLRRGNNSYILGKLKLQTLEKPATIA